MSISNLLLGGVIVDCSGLYLPRQQPHTTTTTSITNAARERQQLDQQRDSVYEILKARGRDGVKTTTKTVVRADRGPSWSNTIFLPLRELFRILGSVLEEIGIKSYRWDSNHHDSQRKPWLQAKVIFQ